MIKEITVQEMKEMKDNNVDFQLIDVRENYEYEIANINGELIPLATIPENVSKINKDKPVIVHCRSGKRSASAIEFLQANHGFTNLMNLKGGIMAWANEIDNTLDVV